MGIDLFAYKEKPVFIKEMNFEQNDFESLLFFFNFNLPYFYLIHWKYIADSGMGGHCLNKQGIDLFVYFESQLYYQVC